MGKKKKKKFKFISLSGIVLLTVVLFREWDLMVPTDSGRAGNLTGLICRAGIKISL